MHSDDINILFISVTGYHPNSLLRNILFLNLTSPVGPSNMHVSVWQSTKPWAT